MEKILITGANGFIGSHLTDFFIDKNFELYAIDIPNISFWRLSHYFEENMDLTPDKKLMIFGDKIQIPTNNEKLKILECDLRNAPLLEKIIQKIKPRYIFHFGAQPLIKPSFKDPAKTIEINVIGTINIFEPLKVHNIKARVILACTATEFGTTASEIRRSLKEDDPLMATHPYGISKIAAELLARQYYLNFGIETINLRFFNQTGPRQLGVATSDFISKIAQIELDLVEPIIEVGNLDPYRDYTGIKDTTQAIWLAALKGKPGETYHVCSGISTQIREVLNIALSFSTKNIKVLENTSNKLRKTEINSLIGDNSKIKKDLGWNVTQSVEEILRAIFNYWINYYKKNKTLIN